MHNEALDKEFGKVCWENAFHTVRVRTDREGRLHVYTQLKQGEVEVFPKRYLIGVNTLVVPLK